VEVAGPGRPGSPRTSRRIRRRPGPPAPLARDGSLVRSYLALLRHPVARWPVLTSIFSRLTPGMIALALVLASRDAGYSYGVAGVVTGAHQVGVGLGSPFQGKLVDRYGQSVVLVPDAIGYGAGCVLLALL